MYCSKPSAGARVVQRGQAAVLPDEGQGAQQALKRQHEDEASWSTRSWLSLQAQRMSVALQLAAAEEIATELRLAAASEEGRRRRLDSPASLRACPSL